MPENPKKLHSSGPSLTRSRSRIRSVTDHQNADDNGKFGLKHSES